MKPYVKYWCSALQKMRPYKPRKITTPNECIHQKIRMEEILLKSSFEKEGKLFLAEFQKLNLENTATSKEFFLDILQNHVNHLFVTCIKEYADLCTLNCISGIELNSGSKSSASKSFVAFPMIDELAETLVSELVGAVKFFYDQKENLTQKLTEYAENFTDSVEKISNGIRNGWLQLSNHAHQLAIESKLATLYTSGQAKYKYVCNDSDASCDICSSLSGKEFHIKDAQVGVNLPPMHPNCRCSIAAARPQVEPSDIVEIVGYTPPTDISEMIPFILAGLASTLDIATRDLGEWWNIHFKESLENYCETFTTVKIDNAEYRINKRSFQGIAIDPSGNFIVPENVSTEDEHLLNLMKRRDSLTEGSAERMALEEEIKRYAEVNDAKLTVKYQKPYSFYLLGGDITEQLHTYMRQTEDKYAYMHDRYWLENLVEFRNIVGVGLEMDLKNQPEWQHSAFIYDGEIVDQDVPGNINYGYFGTYCNIPQSVLMAGAGYAQLSAGNAKVEFIITLFDDPRDTYRSFQGIELYEDWH